MRRANLRGSERRGSVSAKAPRSMTISAIVCTHSRSTIKRRATRAELSLADAGILLPFFTGCVSRLAWIISRNRLLRVDEIFAGRNIDDGIFKRSFEAAIWSTTTTARRTFAAVCGSDLLRSRRGNNRGGFAHDSSLPLPSIHDRHASTAVDLLPGRAGKKRYGDTREKPRRVEGENMERSAAMRAAPAWLPQNSMDTPR